MFSLIGKKLSLNYPRYPLLLGALTTNICTVELQWLEYLSSSQGYFEPMRVDNSARSGGIIGISFQVYLT